jgi:hypothetical protein
MHFLMKYKFTGRVVISQKKYYQIDAKFFLFPTALAIALMSLQDAVVVALTP